MNNPTTVECQQAAVVIYSTAYCPYCIRARERLHRRGIDYVDIDVGRVPALRLKMQRLSGRHSVPQIFIHGNAIGGCNELYALDASDALQRCLQSASR